MNPTKRPLFFVYSSCDSIFYFETTKGEKKKKNSSEVHCIKSSRFLGVLEVLACVDKEFLEEIHSRKILEEDFGVLRGFGKQNIFRGQTRKSSYTKIL